MLSLLIHSFWNFCELTSDSNSYPFIVSRNLSTMTMSTLFTHTIHSLCSQQRSVFIVRSVVVHRSRPLLLVCTEVYYLRLATFTFIPRLRVHDRSSNKVMSQGQDHNPVHSPPMIELGLEGLFISSVTVYLVEAIDLA